MKKYVVCLSVIMNVSGAFSMDNKQDKDGTSDYSSRGACSEEKENVVRNPNPIRLEDVQAIFQERGNQKCGDNTANFFPNYTF